MHKLPIDLLSC